LSETFFHSEKSFAKVGKALLLDNLAHLLLMRTTVPAAYERSRFEIADHAGLSGHNRAVAYGDMIFDANLTG
jgi:hypothetical protein